MTPRYHHLPQVLPLQDHPLLHPPLLGSFQDLDLACLILLFPLNSNKMILELPFIHSTFKILLLIRLRIHEREPQFLQKEQGLSII